jgi:hypothetical protein
MNRTIIALALILLASPVAALERSPGGPLGRDADDHQASSERGERTSGGGKDRTASGRESFGRESSGRASESRSYVERDHGGHAGD